MRREKHFLIPFLAVFLLLSPDTWAQSKLKALLNNLPAGNVASVKFDAGDPVGNASKSTAGMPWEKADAEPIELPSGVTAVIPDPLPDIADLSMIDYNSAVAVAFESMRLVYGDMSDKDAQKFSSMWAPLYDHPSQDIIEYFNKLNPLLSQFLAARESYFRTVADIQILCFDAAEAVGQDDRDSFDSIIFQTKLLTGAANQLEAAIAELADRIQKLGNPPNPFTAKAEARRKYNSGFTQREVTVPYLGECWMGTRESKIQSSKLEPLTETVFRYLFKAKVNGEDWYYVIELGENGTPTDEEMDDELACLKYMDVNQVDYNTKAQRPDFTSDGKFQTYFPKPPVLAITTLTMTYMRQREISRDVDQEYYFNVCHYGNRVLRAGTFFKVAIEWSYEGKWNEYTFYPNGMVPKDALKDFAEAVREEMRQDLANREKSRQERREAAAQAKAEAPPMTEEALRQKAVQDSLAYEKKSKDESIEVRKELIQDIQRQITREKEYKSRAIERLHGAKTPAERESASREIDDINRRIMNYESNIQNERDNIKTLETGEYVHTRTVSEQYAFGKMIQNMQEDAARRDATRRYAEGIERQIRLLPTYGEREDARERAYKLLYEDGALVSGDVEKAHKLATLFNNQILAGEMKVQAEAEEEIAYADLKEAGANAVIMACGSITVGLAGEAFASAYGTSSAAALWGPKVIGAVYGGATGYIAGGTAKGVCSAAGYIHPVGATLASFYEGYAAEGNGNMSTGEKIWEGCKQAGYDYLVGKAVDLGAGIFVKSATAITQNVKAKFKSPPKLTLKQKNDMMRTQKQRLEAQDAVKTFDRVNAEYNAALKGGNQAEIAATKESRDKLAAVLNADYHAKWEMKYKASPELRAGFDAGVQSNYQKMVPKMTAELEAKGFKMDDIEFKQFRNSSSSGSSSMDLDMAPVSKTTGKEPIFFRDGKQVKPAEFMAEAQKTMNSVYRAQTGMSAKASEMNLTTSAHPEAYNTEALLEQHIDFYSLTTKDVASVGRVIDVKMESIENNPMMSATTKMQAKCREATKEIQNMLLPKLEQDLKHCKTDAARKTVQDNINYWKDMQSKFLDLGTKAGDPGVIHQINNEIMLKTGGKDATQVCNDLAREFDAKF